MTHGAALVLAELAKVVPLGALEQRDVLGAELVVGVHGPRHVVQKRGAWRLSNTRSSARVLAGGGGRDNRGRTGRRIGGRAGGRRRAGALAVVGEQALGLRELGAELRTRLLQPLCPARLQALPRRPCFIFVCARALVVLHITPGGIIAPGQRAAKKGCGRNPHVLAIHCGALRCRHVIMVCLCLYGRGCRACNTSVLLASGY